jgi:hypothetical protein
MRSYPLHAIAIAVAALCAGPVLAQTKAAPTTAPDSSTQKDRGTTQGTAGVDAASAAGSGGKTMKSKKEGPVTATDTSTQKNRGTTQGTQGVDAAPTASAPKK